MSFKILILSVMVGIAAIGFFLAFIDSIFPNLDSNVVAGADTKLGTGKIFAMCKNVFTYGYHYCDPEHPELSDYQAVHPLKLVQGGMS